MCSSKESPPLKSPQYQQNPPKSPRIQEAGNQNNLNQCNQSPHPQPATTLIPPFNHLAPTANPMLMLKACRSPFIFLRLELGSRRRIGTGLLRRLGRFRRGSIISSINRAFPTSPSWRYHSSVVFEGIFVCVQCISDLGFRFSPHGSALPL